MKTGSKRAPVLGGRQGPDTQDGCAPSVARVDGTSKTRHLIPFSERLLLGEVEVAQLCGVSRWVVRRWKDEGRLRPVRLPGDVRRNMYRRGDVERLMASLPPRED